MRVLLVGGFSVDGKKHLVQQLASRILASGKDSRLSIILSEIREGDLSGSIIDSDTIQVEEVRGGCPCCTMERDLRRLLKKDAVARSDHIVLEVAGTCDLRQLEGIVRNVNELAAARSILVLDAATLPCLSDVVPVLKTNIHASDVIVLTKGIGDDGAVLEGAMRILTGIRDDLVPHGCGEWGQDALYLTKKGTDHGFPPSHI